MNWHWPQLFIALFLIQCLLTECLAYLYIKRDMAPFKRFVYVTSCVVIYFSAVVALHAGGFW